MKYYIAENGQQAGPFEPNELLLHGLTVNSLVWCEGMANWTSASQVPELMALLSGQTFNPGGVDTQLPQMPPMGNQQPQIQPVPPFGGQPTQPQPQQPTNYGQANQPYAQPQYGPSNNQPSNNQVMPKNWLTECIIVTVISALCCCNPVAIITGIVSIVKANGSKNKYMTGDITGSAKDGSSAKNWMLITIVIMIAWACIQTYRLMTNPELLQQIQNGTFGSLYGV